MTVTFYYYDPASLRPTTSYGFDWPEDRPDPPDTLRVAPPTPGENQFVRVNPDRSGWELAWDYTQSTFYSKADGSEVKLEVGEKPGPNLTTEKPEPGQEWVTSWSADGSDGGQWSYPRAYLEERATNAIRAERERRLNLPIDYNSITYDANQQSITNMMVALIHAGASADPAQTMEWRDAKNATQQITLADLKGLSDAIFVRNQALYAFSWSLNDNLPSLSSAELDPYQIPADWTN